MQFRGWGVLSLLALPASVLAQSVTKADLVGGWEAKLTQPPGREDAGSLGWLILWPDGLWWYGGPLTADNHGGARWRLVGDTLWLANDYDFYFHKMIGNRLSMYTRKDVPYGVMDEKILKARGPFPVPDSIYWSKAFRDTTSECAEGTPGAGGCGTWVYKVSKRGSALTLVRLDKLSQGVMQVVSQAVLRRNFLAQCIGKAITGCD